jgi:hypothetical protein
VPAAACGGELVAGGAAGLVVADSAGWVAEDWAGIGVGAGDAVGVGVGFVAWLAPGDSGAASAATGPARCWCRVGELNMP